MVTNLWFRPNFERNLIHISFMSPKPYPEPTIPVPRFEEALGFYTSPARSKTMARIKGKNTKPEILFRKALWRTGIRFRVHNKKLPGKPDIANRKLKFVAFIDGEFWHGKDWEKKKATIKSNRKFWLPKIERNRQRDREVNQRLEKLGFKVFRFWQADVEKNLGACLMQVLSYVENKL